MVDETLLEEMPAWLREHARAYLETDGREGHMWDSTVIGGPGPVQCLLLTTVGCKTGKKRLLPLIYGETEGGVVVPREIPAAEVGDYVLIHDAGAYAASMASNYNTRPLAPEILLEGAETRLIRRRQGVEELIELEEV